MRHVSFCRSYRCRGTSRPLRCEPLEDRRLLTITVDTLFDEADGNIDDGDTSLRDAIAAAVPGETIDFDASLDGGTILLTLRELPITKTMTVDATSLDDGLTIDASGNRDHIPQTTEKALHAAGVMTKNLDEFKAMVNQNGFGHLQILLHRERELGIEHEPHFGNMSFN